MMFFYPDNIEIISRQISYSLSGGILRRSAQEKISFKNKSIHEESEIAIEVEHFRSNLRITDEDNREIVYLTNEKLKDKNELPDDIKKNIHLSEREKEKNILWLMLNKPIPPKAYGLIFLNYIEYARRTDDHSDAKKNEMTYVNHRMSKEAIYYDAIDFYCDETLSIFSHWEDALELNGYDFYYFKKHSGSVVHLDPNDINSRNNWISFGISKSKRVENDISSIRLIHLFMPQKEQLRLIQVLTWFTLLFPFTEFISLPLDSVSYLFASIEVETVLILTLAFAETRTGLISHKKLITIALVITGAFFLGILGLLFGFWNLVLKFL